MPPSPEVLAERAERQRGHVRKSHKKRRDSGRDRGSTARDNDPRTRAEMLAELASQRARLDMAALSGADLQAAKECISGIVTVLNMAAEFNMARELTFTPDEQGRLAELWAPPMAPYLSKLGSAQPWVAAVAGTAFLVWPKWVAYIDRREREKVEIVIETPKPGAPDNGPPATTAEVHTHPELMT